MKKLILKIMVITSFLGFFGCKSSSDPANWSNQKIDKWFEKGEWLNGWNIKPDGSINRKEFAISYFKNKDRWDKAFTFLKVLIFQNLKLSDMTLMEIICMLLSVSILLKMRKMLNLKLIRNILIFSMLLVEPNR